MSADNTRRTAWVAIGILGLPAAVLGLLYIVGPFWILFVGSVSFVASRWRRTEHLPAILLTLLVAALVADRIDMALDRSRNQTGWLVAQLFLILSIAAMTLAATKLGRIAGHPVWHPRPRTDG